MVEKSDVAAVLELIRPSLQADGGVAFDERHANAAGGLSCKARQRDWRNRCRALARAALCLR